MIIHALEGPRRIGESLTSFSVAAALVKLDMQVSQWNCLEDWRKLVNVCHFKNHGGSHVHTEFGIASTVELAELGKKQMAGGLEVLLPENVMQMNAIELILCHQLQDLEVLYHHFKREQESNSVVEGFNVCLGSLPMYMVRR